MSARIAVCTRAGPDRLRELLSMYEAHTLRGGDFNSELGQEFINLGRDPEIIAMMTDAEVGNVFRTILVIRSEYGLF